MAYKDIYHSVADTIKITVGIPQFAENISQNIARGLVRYMEPVLSQFLPSMGK